MVRNLIIQSPFFEIGPKNYLFGRDVVDLARVADKASRKYSVNVIFTAPYVNITEVITNTDNLYVFAPHMDSASVGRGLANILPESLKAAGVRGVMLNHVEKQLTVSQLCNSINRARQLDVMTVACASGIQEIKAVSTLGPDMIVAEPSELIETGQAVKPDFVNSAVEAVASINKDIGVLVAGGVSSGTDAYNVIYAGADATGSSSGIVKAGNPEAMIDEMLAAVRQAWDDRMGGIKHSADRL